MHYGRVMGIDYGEKRIGIAMTDLMQVISSPFQVYQSVSPDKDIEYISELIKDYSVETVVFGMPYNMDGTEGARAIATRKFAELLENRTNVKVDFEDERLTSVEAEEILLSANVRRQKRKQLIDKVSASIILDAYINRNKTRS